MDILTNVVAADRNLAESKIRAAFAEGHAEAEIGLVGNGDAVRRYLFSVGRLALNDGPGILGIGIDVTEARRIEKQLHEGEQRFRTIFSSVSDGILLRDHATAVVVEVNESACHM